MGPPFFLVGGEGGGVVFFFQVVFSVKIGLFTFPLDSEFFMQVFVFVFWFVLGGPKEMKELYISK
jgi:hypothetical protein